MRIAAIKQAIEDKTSGVSAAGSSSNMGKYNEHVLPYKQPSNEFQHFVNACVHYLWQRENQPAAEGYNLSQEQRTICMYTVA